MEIRKVQKSELQSLLLLYTQLHDNPMPQIDNMPILLWDNICHDKNYYIIVAVENEKIVASCTLIIIPNLTNQQRSYALIENVITDVKQRGKGKASACMTYAKKIALQNKCYKIMLMTGSKNESTLGFYERAGYDSKEKTAFIQRFNF